MPYALIQLQAESAVFCVGAGTLVGSCGVEKGPERAFASLAKLF